MKINGADPDFHRRDLWDAIEAGDFPEWELGLQLFDAETAALLPFDALDPTKLITEELVPVRRVGRLVLDRNVKNAFAETEQVAFGTQNIVPGIEFSNDPVLQGRNFSYLDTQVKRLGSPNFAQLPINAPQCPFRHFQQDGSMALFNPSGRVNYAPNSWLVGRVRRGGGRAAVSCRMARTSSGAKIRARPESFADHYNQARQFYVEPNAARAPAHRGCARLRAQQGRNAGDPLARRRAPAEHRRQARDERRRRPAPRRAAGGGDARRAGRARSAGVAVAQHHAQPAADVQRPPPRRARDRRRRRRLLAAARDGVQRRRRHGGAHRSGDRRRQERGRRLDRGQQTLATAPSVLFDAVAIVVAPQASKEIAKNLLACAFVADAYAHCKFIAYTADARPLLERALAGSPLDAGCKQVETAMAAAQFAALCAQLRFWAREPVLGL